MSNPHKIDRIFSKKVEARLKIYLLLLQILSAIVLILSYAFRA